MPSEQKHSYSVDAVLFGRPKSTSGGVYKSALIPVFSTGPRYCNGNVLQISLSQRWMISAPVWSRGGKKDPASIFQIRSCKLLLYCNENQGNYKILARHFISYVKRFTFRSRNGIARCVWPIWQMIKPVQSIYQTELFHVRVSSKYCGYLAQCTVSLQSEFHFKLLDKYWLGI